MRLYSILRCQSFQSFNELLIPSPQYLTTNLSYPRKAGANVILLFYSYNTFFKNIFYYFFISTNGVWKRTISDLGRQMYYNNVTYKIFSGTILLTILPRQ